MNYKEKYLYWLNSPNVDDETKSELAAIADNDVEIKSRFIKELEFGTAGV